MREVNVTPLSEVHVVEDEDHAGHSHTNRGENMRGEGSGQAEATLGAGRCKSRGKFDILDAEAWDKLCEYGIGGVVLWYEVIRLCREGEVLGLLESDVKSDIIQEEAMRNTHKSVR
jgi:hypothetical protein